ncbi:hypothetical protein ACR80Q_11590 [Aquipuribacter sp. MA13-6]
MGREALLDKLRAAVRRPEGVRAGDLVGDSGAGRTTLLRRIKDDKDGFPDVVLVDLLDFDPGHPGQTGERVSVGAVQASFGQLCRVLLEILHQVDAAEGQAAVEAKVNESRQQSVVAGRVSDLDMSLEELERAFDPQDLALAWVDAAEKVIATFAVQWQLHLERSGTRPVVLFDNFDRVAEQELGVWLLRHVAGDGSDGAGRALADSFVVRTRTPPSRTPPDENDTDSTRTPVQLEAKNLSANDVRKYLNTINQGPAVEKAISQLVFELTEGHAATLRLVGDLLRGALRQNSAARLLEGLEDTEEERAAELIERVLEARDQEWLIDVVRAVAVPRRFDAQLMSTLTPEVDTSSLPKSKPLFQTVLSLSCVEPSTDRKAARVSRFVRTSMLTRMRVNFPDELQHLHELAEAHYRTVLKKDQEDSKGVVRSYGDWYLTESPEWQQKQREWLYHAAHVGESRRKEVVLEAATLFLDAFWWWGMYLHYDFCDRLLADLTDLVGRAWANRSTGTSGLQTDWPEMSLLQQGLEVLLHEYPLRSHKSPVARWDQVEGALDSIEAACGLSRRHTQLSDEETHVSALIHLFRAHAWRFRAVDPLDASANCETAVRLYEQANELFAGGRQDDSWDRAWVDFEMADTLITRVRTAGEALSAADRRRVMSLARRAAEEIQALDPGAEGGRTGAEVRSDDGDGYTDHELMSDLHRLRADIAQIDGDAYDAAGWLGRAVRHAYLFHVAGPNTPPDEYTMQFYVDIRARAISLLASLWKRGEHELAERSAVRMWHFARSLPETQPWVGRPLAELLAEAAGGTPVPLAEALFVRGPDVTELGPGTFTSPYAAAVRREAYVAAKDGVLVDLQDAFGPLSS